MLDYVELPKSIGTTSLFTSQDTIWFDAGGGWRGSILIKRKGMAHFMYECVVGGRIVPEVMSNPMSSGGRCAAGGRGGGGGAGGAQEVAADVFVVRVRDPVSAQFGSGEPDTSSVSVTWYPVETRRERDGVSTTVHRRFQDFAELDEAVRAALAGHHLYDSLPQLPPKASKLLYSHSDPAFQEQRRAGLDVFLKRIVDIPRALAIPSTLPFIGIANGIQELSFVFTDASIGITIERIVGVGNRGGGEGPFFPAVVSAVRDGPAAGNLRVGDVVSKVNGVSCSTMTFAQVVRYIGAAQRPLVCHFIQSLRPTTAPLALTPGGAAAKDSSPLPGAAATEPPRPPAGAMPAATAAHVAEFDDMPLGDGEEGDFFI